MNVTPRGHNVVLLAEQFRPGLFSDHWLVRNQIAPEGAIAGNRISTEAMSTVSTSLFQLIASGDRVQVTLLNAGSHAYSELRSPLEKIIANVPDPGYKAVGLNHLWNVKRDSSDQRDIVEFLRGKFGLTGAFAKLAAGDSGIWGTMVSQPWNGGRCKTTVGASFPKGIELGKPTGVVVDCNFHFDVSQTQDPIQSVRDVIARFDEAAEFSFQIAVSVAE
jgi:hypothetical protein